MKSVTVGGKKYTKASSIARDLGYTTDYVGQLCRAKKVDAQLIGRSWFVDEDSLKEHKSNRYRSTKSTTARAVRGELSARSGGEDEQRTHFYNRAGVSRPKVSISYVTDEAELLPTPQKTQQAKATKLDVELADATELSIGSIKQEYHFEAPERPEIRFHGTLEVTDVLQDISVSEDLEDSTPRKVNIQKSGSDTKKQRKKIVARKNVPGVISIHKAKTRTTVTSTTNTTPQDQEAPQTTVRTGVYIAFSGFVSVSLLVLILGLEAQVVANDTLVSTKYIFKIENTVAQLYASI